MTELRAPLLAFLFLAALCGQVQALSFSKTPQHYAVEMESYYQRPRPEMLASMLKGLGNGGILENAEKRMLVAAFLAALEMRHDISILKIADEVPGRGRGVGETLAWAAHLGGVGKDAAKRLHPDASPSLEKQMGRSPGPLEEWDPKWEKSVVEMYWGAFMATGETRWLDGIINAALDYARTNRGEAGRHAAATLYDYAPGHKKISDRIRQRLAGAQISEKGVLELILRHAEQRAAE